MKRDQKDKTVKYFVRRNHRGKLDLNPGYQRGAVWTNKQKRMLVDTILRDMDIPKIYVREVSGEYDYEIVDGQQRLRAVIDFCKGEFKTEPGIINGKEIGAVTYDNLDAIDDDFRDHFDSYEFSVVVLRDATEDDVEEMFLRLQSGTSLNAQEKRNARSGKMRDFIRELAGHDFFKRCAFQDRRFAYAHIASQMTMLEIKDGSHSIKNVDLDKMYDDINANFDSNSAVAREIRKTLSCLSRAFLENTPELEKHNAISMFLLFRHFRENYVITGREEEIAKWFVEFEQFRIKDMKKKTDERDDVELIEYQEKTGHSTDSVDSLDYRQKVLRARLLMAIPDMVLLDEQRSFTEDQRRAIWRRDEGVCQIADKCDGTKWGWNSNWHADHKVPWSAGGKTSVENGQVACATCNLAKGGRQ